MFGMTLSFYGLPIVLGLFIPMFSGDFRFSLFILYTILAILCGIAALILYGWNKNHSFSSILYALPVGALVAETFAVSIYLVKHHTFLFQLLMDGVRTIVFGIMLYRKSRNKILFFVSFVVSFLVFY